jgi:hypothetical protein
MKLTPNVKRLMFEKLALEAIPPGCGNGLAVGIEFLKTPGALQSGLRAAHDWTQAAIATVRLAAEPNPWKHADDETIATEIMRHVDAKKARKRTA